VLPLFAGPVPPSLGRFAAGIEIRFVGFLLSKRIVPAKKHHGQERRFARATGGVNTVSLVRERTGRRSTVPRGDIAAYIYVIEHRRESRVRDSTPIF
jgi:hypothetical protein